MSSMFLLAFTIAGLLIVESTKVFRGPERSIKISNDSGSAIQVYWINPETRAPALLSNDDVQHGVDFPLNSFVGHEFEIREATNNATDCRHAYFQVTDHDDQRATVSKDFSVVFVDDKIRAAMAAKEIVASCKAANGPKDVLLCLESRFADALEEANNEIAFQSSIRQTIAASLEPYTCNDSALESSADIATSNWAYDGKNYSVHIKLDRQASKIHAIENFISEEECQAVQVAAESLLHNATVADGKGGSQLSSSRKALQAGVEVPWQTPDHPIARLSRRTYGYLNHVLGLGIQYVGQEDLMSIQYFGRGRNDTEPDHYTPHCDGDCTGLPHKHGTRMATIVMYCQVAMTGGHTNFRNAGVHVKPRRHDAVFFSYIDPETKKMDDGFTEHSGCPVYEGSKKIAVQWFRFGVSEQEPWTAFNTLGIKK